MCNKTSKTIEYYKIFLRWIIKRAHGISFHFTSSFFLHCPFSVTPPLLVVADIHVSFLYACMCCVRVCVCLKGCGARNAVTNCMSIASDCMFKFGNSWCTTRNVFEVHEIGALRWANHVGNVHVQRWLISRFPRFAELDPLAKPELPANATRAKRVRRNETRQL
jgi:hypothetical protein